MAWRSILTWYGLLTVSTSAVACPFCAKMSRSLADDLRESEIVLFGDIVRHEDSARLIARSTIRSQLSDTHSGEFDLSSKSLSTGNDRVVFGHLEGNALVPTRVERSNPARASYLSEVNRGLNIPQVERLIFFFHRLDDADSVIAADAYAEFAKASYRATRLASDSFDAARIRRWLQDEETPPERIGLFGLLLGLCGHREDAELLKKMVDAPTPTQRVGMDGLLGGLYHLAPDDARRRISRWLTESEASSLQRLSALSALQFILLELPPPDAKEWLLALTPGLKQADSAAPLVDEMRRGACWNAAEPILALASSLVSEDSADAPTGSRVLEPAVVRFALQCPKPECRLFIERAYQRNPILIQEARQAIEFEENARSLLPDNAKDR